MVIFHSYVKLPEGIYHVQLHVCNSHKNSLADLSVPMIPMALFFFAQLQQRSAKH